MCALAFIPYIFFLFTIIRWLFSNSKHFGTSNIFFNTLQKLLKRWDIISISNYFENLTPKKKKKWNNSAKWDINTPITLCVVQ